VLVTVDRGAAMRARLCDRFRWVADRGESPGADLSGWWADGEILAGLGSELAGLHEGFGRLDAVIAPESSGLLVGALTAAALGTGLIAVRKDPGEGTDSDRWRVRTSPPDYLDRHLVLGVPHRHLASGLRVLFVDDWIDTGGQAITVRQIVHDAGAAWIGAALIVDALESSRLRRDLRVKALLHVRDL
jgi:adenine phosphoribosyltransferase